MQKPTEFDLHRAALTGMGNFNGDPEVAEDLGIAVTSESFHSHLNSAREAPEVLRGSRAEASATGKRGQLAQEVAGIMCGDCLEVIAAGANCGHMDVSRNGKPRLRG